MRERLLRTCGFGLLVHLRKSRTGCWSSRRSLPVVARRNSGYFAHNLDEALLVDEELADQVWEAWDAGEIDDLAVCVVWLWIAPPM